MKQKLPPETWRMIIQIAITILTALSGMFAEAQNNTIALLLHEPPLLIPFSYPSHTP